MRVFREGKGGVEQERDERSPSIMGARPAYPTPVSDLISRARSNCTASKTS